MSGIKVELDSTQSELVGTLAKLGREAWAHKDVAMAEAKFLEAWDVIPEPKERYRLGQSMCGGMIEFYRQTRQYDKARAWLELLAPMYEPGNVYTEQLRGVVAFDAGDSAEAYMHFDRVYAQGKTRGFESVDPKYLNFYMAQRAQRAAETAPARRPIGPTNREIIDASLRLAHAVSRLVFLMPRTSGGTARLLLEVDAEGLLSLRTVTTTASGKVREKAEKPDKFGLTFGYRLVDKVMRSLMRKGMVGRAESHSGETNLVLLTAVGPPLRGAFDVDEARHAAWLGDWGALRRVDLETGEVTSIPLGACGAVYEVNVEADGVVTLLAERDEAPPTGPWRAPASATVRFAVLTWDGVALTSRYEIEVPSLEVQYMARTLSSSRNGTRVVPHPKGAALLDASWNELATYELRPLHQGGPTAAISPNARWVATTGTGAEVVLHDLLTGESTTRLVDYADVTQLRVNDEGTVELLGAGPLWDFRTLTRAGDVRSVEGKSSRYGADAESVYSVDQHELHLWDRSSAEKRASIPTLGGIVNSRIIVTETAVYTRSDQGVFQRTRK